MHVWFSPGTSKPREILAQSIKTTQQILVWSYAWACLPTHGEPCIDQARFSVDVKLLDVGQNPNPALSCRRKVLVAENNNYHSCNTLWINLSTLSLFNLYTCFQFTNLIFWKSYHSSTFCRSVAIPEYVAELIQIFCINIYWLAQL